MENITLQELYVEGFRGFKEGQAFRFDTQLTRFEGENGQGKTSIGEAIAWVMTGKGLNGASKNLNVRNQDSKRTLVHLQFTLNGVPHEIERRMSGSSAKVRFDGEDCSQKYIEQIFDPAAFLICLNPMIFLGMTETPARNLIVSLFDEVTKEDVLDQMTDKEQSFLQEETFRVDQTNEYLKTQNRRKKELSEELIHLEGAVTQHSTPIQVPVKPVLDKTKLDEARSGLEKILARRPQPKGAEAYESSIRAIDSEIRELQSRKFPKAIEAAELTQKRKYLLTEYKRIDAEVFRLEPIDPLMARRDILLSAYQEAKREKKRLQADLDSLKDAKCSGCGQTLPASKAEEKAADVKRDLDVVEAKLAKSLNEGKENNEKLQELIKLNESNQKAFELKKQESLESIRKEGMDIADQLKGLESERVAFEKKVKEEIQLLVQKRTGVEKEKAEEMKGMKGQMEAYEADLKAARSLVSAQEADFMVKQKELSSYETAMAAEKNRMKVLADFEKTKLDIEKEQAKVAERIFYMKQFVLRKTAILREEMRKHLNRVDLILEHVNEETGEVKNAFEVRYDGKPVHVCSLSEQMRASMEIADMISSLNGYEFPLFLDNAESITHYQSKAKQIIEVRVVKGASLQTYSVPQAGPTIRRPKGA